MSTSVEIVADGVTCFISVEEDEMRLAEIMETLILPAIIGVGFSPPLLDTYMRNNGDNK